MTDLYFEETSVLAVFPPVNSTFVPIFRHGSVEQKIAYSLSIVACLGSRRLFPIHFARHYSSLLTLWSYS